MKHLVYILLGLAVVAFGACGGNQFKDRLCHLDSLLIEHPDSVLQVLEGMHEEALTQAKGNRMYYELMRADAQNKAYVDFTTDSVMKIVADYYDRHGSANEQMRAHYLLGCTYRDLNDVPMELQCFQEAVEKADTTQKDCDLYTLYAVYSQMADIYDEQYLPEKELETWDICEKIAWKDKDTLSAIVAYELHLRAYYLLNMPDSVLSVSENARQKYFKIGNIRKAARLVCPAINILLDREDYEKANIYIDDFEKNSDCFYEDGEIKAHAALFLHSKGRYELHKNNIDLAEYYFRKLLVYNKQEAAYQGLLSVYDKIGQADSVLKYSRLYALANDSSHIGKNSETIAQMAALYNYGRQKRNAEVVQSKLLVEQKKSATYLTVTLILIVFAVVCAYFYKKNRRKTIEQIKLLNQEIEHKTLLLNHAIMESKDIEKLNELRQSLENAKQELLKYKTSDALAAFRESDIYRLFRSISTKGNGSISSTEWDTFTRLFNTTFARYSEFIHSGKSVTEDQIKICMLIRLGFGETEMANILGVDLKRISRIKTQINSKLFNVYNAKDLLFNLQKNY